MILRARAKTTRDDRSEEWGKLFQCFIIPGTQITVEASAGAILIDELGTASSLVGEFVPFSMVRIRLMTRVELHTHPHSSRMRLPQHCFVSL